MQQALQRSSLVPGGFVVESAYYEGDKAVIVIRAFGRQSLHFILVQRPARRADYAPQARQTSNVRSRENRSASSPTNRCRITGAAPKLRQSPILTPYRRPKLQAE
jgi:hypothetical protein